MCKFTHVSKAVVLSVTDDIGVSYVMDILPESCRARDAATRRGAVTLLHGFCAETRADFAEFVPQLMRALLLLVCYVMFFKHPIYKKITKK